MSGSFITLQNYTDYRSPYGSRYVSGRVVACVNGSFVTVCNNTAFPEYFARQACNQRIRSTSIHAHTSLCLSLCLSNPLFVLHFTNVYFKIILSFIIPSLLSPSFLSLFFFTDYTIVPFDPVYLNGDTNLIINNCSGTPSYSSGYTYFDNTVRDGTCSNGSPLIVRCEAG